ncbi:alpha/beta hydrolase fold domain-containing protein [Amycolatopsis sp. NBC_00438]|uniref:alpha/beta hydrolase fold domain-containing protein n=1 Tax=Amycolatopsis sp. NBC_00438 TaxID=2903558 RepID=UPI002E24C75B
MRAEYRLGPETRAPGAAEDGYLAYTHLAGHAAELRIGPAGASSGGAPATALMARDRRAPQPNSLSLLRPMPDDRLETSCFESSAEVVRTREDTGLAGPRSWVTGRHPATCTSYAAPGRATGLPTPLSRLPGSMCRTTT